ncbi:EamA family transporter RarD [Neptunomonas sp.]|uniref:EamA family transporter RarD n=1 Tax=Neptunomonas sp. TaxID=1971898 RepID=UPI0025F8871E|nr:EamA family transporter RarD [Neptunomonas sp.]
MTDFSRSMFQALSAYLIWGCFALFFHQLQHIPPIEVLLHRLVWAFVFVAVVLTLSRRWGHVRDALGKPTLVLQLFASSLLIASNWIVYIWSVGIGDAVGASLGYFISPLVGIALGVWVLKERILPYQTIALILAVVGVSYKIFGTQEIPWASLALAVSFGLYGLIRKQTSVDTVTGLMIESLLLLPFALGYWLWIAWNGEQHFSLSIDGLLLVSAGVMTALPLLAYASAARHLSLVILGFMLYLAPSLQLLTGVFILGEPFDVHQQITFSFIFAGLIVLTGGAILRHHRATGK